MTLSAATARPSARPTSRNAGAVCSALSTHSPSPRPRPTQTAADSPMLRKAMAPGSGLGSSGRSGWGDGSGSVTRLGAQIDPHLNTHATAAPLCGAWRAGVRRPRGCQDGSLGRGEVDGVHRPHHRIPAQMASKRSGGKPDHLADPLRPFHPLRGRRNSLVALLVLVLVLPVPPPKPGGEEGVEAHPEGGGPDRD